jgi:ubiquinone/menaquinone biosynthesis C-methylase UbiE
VSGCWEHTPHARKPASQAPEHPPHDVERTGPLVTGSSTNWDRVAAAYATSPIHAAGPDLSWLVETLEPARGDAVLDLGCGAGHAGFAVSAAGAIVTAVDTSERMLETARLLADERGLSGYSAVRADVAALPFADSTFDGVVSRYSAHHWPHLAAALAEAARVVRPGGRIVVIDTVAPDDPALDTLVNALELLRDPTHGRNLRPAEWRSAFAAAGLEVVDVRQWQIVLETVSWFARAQTEAWRADAARALLRAATPEAVEALAIDGAAAWSLPAALIAGRRSAA